MVASGHLHYSLSLLFLTFSISTFRSNHRKCSIKAVLKVLNIQRNTPMWQSLFDKVQCWRPSTLLKRGSNTGIFLGIFLFTNNYRITCLFFGTNIFSKNDCKRKNVTPIKRAHASTILVIMFWDFLIISLTSESRQVKLYLISSTTNLIHELPHEWPNDLRLRILGN